MIATRKPKVPAPNAASRHVATGRDAMGNGLTITIRIGPDGSVYVHDLTGAIVPIIAALCPNDAALQQRLCMTAAFAAQASIESIPTETVVR